MALVLANRVQETTATTGTGTVTLAGAVSGYQSFSAIGNGNTTYYTITSGTAWEVGIGTYTSAGTTLARTTILSSSASGSAITLAGTSNVFATYPAEKSVNLDASGNATALGTPASGTVTNLTGTASININGTVGATTASTGAFTTLSASSTVSGTGFSTYLASPPAIGGTAAAAITGTTITANTAFAGPHNGTVGATTPNTGAFTTLSASSTVSGTGFSTYLASPPAIGGTAPAAGAFTTLNWTGVSYTAAGSAQGAAITDYFASTISLDAASIYDIDCVAYFLKTTAGSVIWTWTFSSAPNVANGFYNATATTGFTTTVLTGTPVSIQASIQSSTTLAFQTSASLTTAVYHVFRFKMFVQTNAATTIQLRSTQSAGTLTPQAGSFMRASKVL